MNMFRRYHISANGVVTAFGPRATNQLMYLFMRQDFPSVLSADGYEQDQRLAIQRVKWRGCLLHPNIITL